MALSLNDPKDVLSIDEAAEILGICREACYRAAHKAEIPVLRVGKRFLVPRVALKRWLETAGANLAEIGKEDPTKTSAKENNLAALAAQEARETQRAKRGGAK